MYKNLTKYWKILLIIPVVIIFVTAFVRGTSANYAAGVKGQRVVLATGGGVVQDKSFNQDAFLGITTFIKDYYGLDAQAAKNNFVEAIDPNKNAILNNYKAALLKKADALVLPGYTHIPPLSDKQANFLDQKTVILIDAPVKKPNIISIIFNAEFAGLQAGFDASVWATRPIMKNGEKVLQGDLNNDNQIRIGTFGGSSAKYSVDYFLFGLFLGMELFNQTIGQEENIRVGFANASDGWSLNKLGPASNADNGYFTNSFDIGDARKSGILGRLIDNHRADILFPVAGPQVADVFNYEAKPTNNAAAYTPYLIGVDSDQTLAYPQVAQKGLFLTSAVKNIHGAVYASLAHSKNLRQKNGADGTLGLYNTAPDTFWDGTQPKAERNWAGSTIGGLNVIKKHALKLFEGEGNDAGAGPLIAGQEYDDVLLEIIKYYHDDNLSSPEEYLNGEFIKTVVNAIAQDVIEKGMIDREGIKSMTPLNDN